MEKGISLLAFNLLYAFMYFLFTNRPGGMRKNKKRESFYFKHCPIDV